MDRIAPDQVFTVVTPNSKGENAMPRIIDLVRERRDLNVREGRKGNHTLAEETGDLARKAITGGIDSGAWEEYMNHFGALTPAQLLRLTGKDQTGGDPNYIIRRAYLVASGVCGMPSPDTGNLPRFVDTIDVDGADAPYLTEPPFDPATIQD